MQKRAIATLIATGCAVAMLTGCGVKQAEFDEKVSELNVAWQEIEELKGSLADMEAELNKEKAAVRQKGIQMEDANERLEKAQASEKEAIDALTAEKARVEELSTAYSEEQALVASEQQKISELEEHVIELKKKYKALQARWEQLEKNLNMLGDEVPSQPSASQQAAPEAGTADSTMSLLDAMSAE